MKKVTMVIWLSLTAAGVFAARAYVPLQRTVLDVPLPTCPPTCPNVQKH